MIDPVGAVATEPKDGSATISNLNSLIVRAPLRSLEPEKRAVCFVRRQSLMQTCCFGVGSCLSMAYAWDPCRFNISRMAACFMRLKFFRRPARCESLPAPLRCRAPGRGSPQGWPCLHAGPEAAGLPRDVSFAEVRSRARSRYLKCQPQVASVLAEHVLIGRFLSAMTGWPARRPIAWTP